MWDNEEENQTNTLLCDVSKEQLKAWYMWWQGGISTDKGTGLTVWIWIALLTGSEEIISSSDVIREVQERYKSCLCKRNRNPDIYKDKMARVSSVSWPFGLT